MTVLAVCAGRQRDVVSYTARGEPMDARNIGSKPIRAGFLAAIVLCLGLASCERSNPVDVLVHVIVSALNKNLPDNNTSDIQSPSDVTANNSALAATPEGITTDPEASMASAIAPQKGATATKTDLTSDNVSVSNVIGQTDTIVKGSGVRRFIHPGLLQTQADFDRIIKQIAAGSEPTVSGWQMLVKNRHASLKYSPRPVPIVYRGFDHVHPENYALLFNDAAAAYALALRWKIGGDPAYAVQAIKVLNDWSSTLTKVDGTSDKFLASGIYGYEMANAAEIMRGYSGWSHDDFARFQAMMLQVFYPLNHDFLVRHNGARIDHYWANWDLANLASMMAIGVLTDRADIYKEAIDYLYNGEGNGALHKTFWKVYEGGLAQIQEAGRDQGHSELDIALIGAICQMAWSQGDDIYGYDNNLVLAGAEYVAKYNLGYDVPYTIYKNSDVTQTTISPGGRGGGRPAWELLYNHYIVLKGLEAPYVSAFAAKVRPEGGGGDYGPNSGGYDQLGYGTLLYTLN